MPKDNWFNARRSDIARQAQAEKGFAERESQREYARLQREQANLALNTKGHPAPLAQPNGPQELWFEKVDKPKEEGHSMYAKPKFPQRERRANLKEALDNLEEIQSSVAYYGLVLVIYGLKAGENHEWQFICEKGRIVFQYWPTTKNSLVAGSRVYKILSGWEEAMELAIDSYFAKKTRNA